MQPEQLLGFSLMLLGAICGGSFGLPTKFAKEDTPWEVLWGPFFLMVTILIPVVVAPLVVNDLDGIYSRVDRSTIVLVLLFGLLWGLGSMTLGMSFAFIGLSLAYALNYGAQIVFGSMMPMLMSNAKEIPTSHGCVILAGVAVCLAGVVVSGWAGILKERSLRKDPAAGAPGKSPATSGKQPKMLIGLIIGVVSGMLCACYSVASEWAVPIKTEAVANNPEWAAAWAVTALILWGGAVSSCLYCIVQLTRNRTWGHFGKPGAGLVLLLAAVMAVLHDAAIFFFGLAWIKLGKLGVPVGYPVFMSFAIIVGNVHGFSFGEWKGASRRSMVWIVVGIALLIIGVCILAKGLSMIPPDPGTAT
ncbi:MAG: L-rhamnose/proton symporter RhaT [Planctomycetota bacterium]|jgi:L-rhamnose-H+ transport protein